MFPAAESSCALQQLHPADSQLDLRLWHPVQHWHSQFFTKGLLIGHEKLGTTEARLRRPVRAPQPGTQRGQGAWVHRASSRFILAGWPQTCPGRACLGSGVRRPCGAENVTVGRAWFHVRWKEEIFLSHGSTIAWEDRRTLSTQVVPGKVGTVVLRGRNRWLDPSSHQAQALLGPEPPTLSLWSCIHSILTADVPAPTQTSKTWCLGLKTTLGDVNSLDSAHHGPWSGEVQPQATLSTPGL